MTEKPRPRGADPHGGVQAPVLGRLERAGEDDATLCRFPSRGLGVTPLTPEQADSLATHLVALGHRLPSVGSDRDDAVAGAGAVGM
ncbi:hypothetical protein [Streptomyces sp. NPDC004546]|uniref:hypothetical protein n=1 Tax=unclassified Streptomyces TaxID=2593676 RepID=UPI0033B30EA4